MSKLSDAVEAISLRRRPLPDLIYADGEIRSDSGIRTEYWEMAVRLGAQIKLPAPTTPGELEHVRLCLCENIVEYVFGEFRTPLLTLRAKLYENGDVANADRVSAILNTMFKS